MDFLIIHDKDNHGKTDDNKILEKLDEYDSGLEKLFSIWICSTGEMKPIRRSRTRRVGTTECSSESKFSSKVLIKKMEISYWQYTL